MTTLHGRLTVKHAVMHARKQSAVAGLVLVLVMPLAACSPGDVQLNGKVFDALGAVTGVGGAEKEVKIANRPGLVVPPSLQKLPEPGATAVPDGQLADIVDYDRKKVVDKSAQQAQHREFCRVNYELPKARGDNTVDTVTGPLGPCRASALGLFGDVFGGKKDDE